MLLLSWLSYLTTTIFPIPLLLSYILIKLKTTTLPFSDSASALLLPDLVQHHNFALFR